MSDSLQDGFQLGDFEVFPKEGRIVNCTSNHESRIQPKIIDVLVCLADANGDVMSRQDIHDVVWGNVVVTDDALNRCISELRRVFGDKRGAAEYIDTVPKRGYRLLQTAQLLTPTRTARSATAFRNRPPRPETAVATIAVLPFENLTPESPNAFLADALPTSLHCGLARLNRIRVSSRRASFDLADKKLNAQEIGAQLGAQYVVSGSIAEAGKRLRVIAEVDDAEAGILLWSQRYEIDNSDVLQLEKQLTEAVIGAFGGQRLRAEISHAQEGQASQLDSWGLVQRARAYLVGYRAETLRDAKALLDEAIAKDPNYALAQAMSALLIAENLINGLSNDAATDTAIVGERAGRALKLAPNDPAVLRTSGSALAYCGDYRAAIKTLRHGLALAPFDLGAWGYLGWPLAATGENADIDELLEICQRLLDTAADHPGAPYWQFHRSVALTLAGNWNDAIAPIEACLSTQPEFGLGLLHYANLLGQLDRSAAAADAVTQAAAANARLTPARYRKIIYLLTDQESVRSQRLDGLQAAGLLV